MLRGAAANASVVAVDDCSLLVLPRSAFEDLLQPLGAALEAALAQRDAELAERSRSSVAWTDLEQGAVLGVGSFGCVRLVRHVRTGATYALKAMHKGHLAATKQVDNVLHERQLLRRCQHPFIMSLHGAFHSRTHVYLLLGLSLGGELFT